MTGHTPQFELPTDAEHVVESQMWLGRQAPQPFVPPPHPRIAGVFVCFGSGERDDTGWSAAAVLEEGRCLDSATVVGTAGGPYRPGLLALREGRLLTTAVRQLNTAFDCVFVNATGRDHPRRAGLAFHLGAHLQIPTVGITTRPLVAEGIGPTDMERGARTPLMLGTELVGYWVRTRVNCRPLVVHAAWRTNPDTAVGLVLAATSRARTPEPLREARRLARTARHQEAITAARPPPALEPATGGSPGSPERAPHRGEP